MSWKLSCFADEAGETIEVQIETLQQAGLRWIDLRKVGGHNVVDLPMEEAREAAARLAAAGIRVNQFGSPIGKIDLAEDFEIDSGRLRHLAAMKDLFGCVDVRMFSYRNKQAGLGSEQFAAGAIDRLRRLADLSDALGMVLWHENECGIFGMRFEQVARIRDELRGEGGGPMRMIFDWANYQHAGDDPREAWRELGDSTDGFHLKEASFTTDGSDDHCPVGEGDGDVPGILADAARRGWQGPLTVEPHLSHSRRIHEPTGLAFRDMPRQQSCLIALEAAKKQLAAVDRLEQA